MFVVLREFADGKFESPNIPFENAIVIGSFCLLAYADMYNLTPVQPIRPNDIDLLVDHTTFRFLESNNWYENVYRGVRTLRDKPNGEHLFDVGSTAHKWTYDDIVSNGLTVTHEGVTYLDPLRMLNWKLALNRKKDMPHIHFIAHLALPAWLNSK